MAEQWRRVRGHAAVARGPCVLQSHDGKSPFWKFAVLPASDSGGGYVLPRLCGSLIGLSDSVSGPIGESWRR
jgi:hypothetical protein